MIRRLSAVAVLALALGFGTACGGDADAEAMTIEEYFTKLEAVIQETSDRFDVLGETMGPKGLGDPIEVQKAEAAAYVTAMSEVADTFEDELGRMAPPDDLQAMHEEFRESTGALVDTFVDVYVTGIEKATTQEELDAATGDWGRFDAAAARVTDGCVALQNAARRESLGVDLDCDK